MPGEDTDFRSDLSPIVQRWTAPYAATDEKHDEAAFAALPEERRVAARGIEVGHIFYFGTKYSEPMRARVTGPDGNEHAVHMGSYGVGVSRLVAAIIEASHDDDRHHLAGQRGAVLGRPDQPEARRRSDGRGCGGSDVRLESAGISVLYDDIDQRAGAKFASMDLIGLPWQLIVGPRGAQGGEVEIKRRATGERETLTIDAAINRLVASIGGGG